MLYAVVTLIFRGNWAFLTMSSYWKVCQKTWGWNHPSPSTISVNSKCSDYDLDLLEKFVSCLYTFILHENPYLISIIKSILSCLWNLSTNWGPLSVIQIGEFYFSFNYKDYAQRISLAVKPISDCKKSSKWSGEDSEWR